MSAANRFPPIADPRPHESAWPPMVWPPPDGVTLTGELVELSPFVPERDAVPLFEALDHDAVWQHMAGRSKTAAEAMANARKKRDESVFTWIVRLRAPRHGLPAGAIVGTSSYLDVAVPHARLEIGFTAYTPQVWATGVNADTKRLLLTYAFETLRVGRVQLKTDVRNVRSQQAIARLGARYEGTLRRYQRRDDGTVRDTVLFSIVAEEWPAVREGLAERVKSAHGQR